MRANNPAIFPSCTSQPTTPRSLSQSASRHTTTGRPQVLANAARNIGESTLSSFRAGGQFFSNHSIKLAFGLNTAALFCSTYGDLHDAPPFKVVGAALSTVAVPIGVLAIIGELRSSRSQEGVIDQLRQDLDRQGQVIGDLENRLGSLEAGQAAIPSPQDSQFSRSLPSPQVEQGSLQALSSQGSESPGQLPALIAPLATE